MKKRIINPILIFLLLIFLLPGCVFISRDFRLTRNDILKEMGDVDIETEVQLQIGPGLLSLSKMIVSATDATDEAIEYLKDIHNVQVGVYNLQNTRGKNVKIPNKIMEKLRKKGYEPMIKTHDHKESVCIMTKMRGDRLKSLYVISVDREQLVLVELQGRLGKIIKKAIEENGLKKGQFLKI